MLSGDDRGIDGVNRFLKRLWNMLMESKEKDIQPTKEMIKLRHRMVYDITTRLGKLQPEYSYFRIYGV